MKSYGNLANKNSVHKRTAHKTAALNGHTALYLRWCSSLGQNIGTASCRANIIHLGTVPERKGISFIEDDIDRQRINWF